MLVGSWPLFFVSFGVGNSGKINLTFYIMFNIMMFEELREL